MRFVPLPPERRADWELAMSILYEILTESSTVIEGPELFQPFSIDAAA